MPEGKTLRDLRRVVHSLSSPEFHSVLRKPLSGAALNQEELNLLEGLLAREKDVRAALEPLIGKEGVNGVLVRAVWLLENKEFP